MLSEHRDMDAAKRFFKAALEVAEQAPEKVTTDGHDSYPRAIRETLGDEVIHRCNPYLNNRLEQDHRGGCPLGEAALLSDAWLWELCCGLMLLSRLRRTTPVLSTASGDVPTAPTAR